jgi:hypothetical protein
MAVRKSQHSLAKMGKVGRKPFEPDVTEWASACKMYQFDKQIFQHFQINAETFYTFLDRQRCLEEEGKKAVYLEAYIRERQQTRKEISDKFLENVKNNDTASILFGMKTHLGFLETKDQKHIELKKIEVAFKTKQFMTELASKFNLNYEQLDDFANKFFRDSKLDDV